MASEHRDIKLGLSSVFDWSVWRANEKRTERTLNTFAKEQSRFHSEYENVSEAYDTVIAFLQSALPEKRLECMQKFRSILESNPKHLNALTDMINSNLVSESEKQRYVSAFTKGLNHDERHIIVGKACLELGMALVELEQTVDFEQTYDQLEKNVLLSQKSRNLDYHIEEIDNQLRSHLQFEKKNEQEVQIADTYATLFTWTHASIMRDRKMQAVRYLSEGIKRVEATLSKDELVVWKYFLAKAYKQLKFKSHQTGFEKHLHNKWTMNAIQLFYGIIHFDIDSGLNASKKEILTTKKARSYIHIGEILHKMPQSEDKSYYRRCIPDADFGKLLETHSLAFEIANKMHPYDISILVRYGKYLLEYPSGAPKTSEQEKNDVSKAIDLLSDAIKEDEEYWFAHAVRMSALKKMYKITNHKHNPANIALLQDAEQDGEFCFFSFPSAGTMCQYSSILHWLADPNRKGGKNIDRDYLQKAIDVLITIDSKFQNHNSARIYKERANCHNLKGDVKEALIYIELAFYANSGPKVSVGVIQLCNYFIDAIEEKKIEKRECAFAFRRLKTALATLLETYREQIETLKCEVPPQDEESMDVLEQYLEAHKERFCSNKSEKHKLDRRNSIKGLVNDVLYDLEKETKHLKGKNAEKPKFYQNLLESMFALKVLIRVSGWVDSLSKYIDQQTVMRSIILDEAEMFVSPETYVPSHQKYRKPYNQTGKGYDFFVLHSDEDNDWVVCCLLQQLEYGQYGFKGCVPERDFEAEKTIQQNIIDKLDDSNKILIVISRKTPKAFFEDLYNILQYSHVTEDDYRDVYVLSVGVEERPQQLLHFPYVKCGPLPLDLNEVRDILALPRQHEMPRVYIQPLREEEGLIDIPSAKCTVDEERKYIASSILELGIPQQVPIYETFPQVESAKTILKFGLPQSDVLVLYERHVVCFDKQKRLAKWVAYKLTKNDIEGPGNRADCRFKTDTRIPDDLQPSRSAFKDDDITRGHMVPAADFKASQSAMHDTFKFTNIYCEKKGNKLWSAVEVYIREKVLKDFPEVWIYIIPAFKLTDRKIVAYQRLGTTGTAVPTHMFKFVIATSDSGDGTLVTGAFVIRNEEGYGSEEMNEGNEEFQKFVAKNIRTDIKTVTKDTGVQFDEMLKSNGHKYNEELLKHCRFITADEYMEYEKKHIQEKTAKNKK